MYYKIKGDYHAIHGTSSAARTKELAERYIRIFKELDILFLLDPFSPEELLKDEEEYINYKP